MRSPACPVGNQVIQAELISSLEPFECPHCGQLLGVVRRRTQAGGWIVIAFVVTLAFQRRFTILGLLGALLLVPVAIGLLNFALNRLLGEV